MAQVMAVFKSIENFYKMNVTRENIDALNATVRIDIAKADYEEKVEKKLREYRRTASIKGFRPGHVPIQMIKKMYGTTVLVDEINNRPMRVLGYRTPAEAFADELLELQDQQGCCTSK